MGAYSWAVSQVVTVAERGGFSIWKTETRVRPLVSEWPINLVPSRSPWREQHLDNCSLLGKKGRKNERVEEKKGKEELDCLWRCCLSALAVPHQTRGSLYDEKKGDRKGRSDQMECHLSGLFRKANRESKIAAMITKQHSENVVEIVRTWTVSSYLFNALDVRSHFVHSGGVTSVC